MNTKTLPGLVIALGLTITSLSHAQSTGDEILTPSDDGTGFDEFGGDDLFGNDFGAEFGSETYTDAPVDSTNESDEESAESAQPTEDTEESSSTEEQTTQSDTEVETVRNIDNQGRINKQVYALHEKVPGAIQAKGMTFLSINSSKMIGKYLPCDTTQDQTLMTAFTRLKLSQGAPVDCREDVQFRLMPYRMYRKSR